MTSTRSVFRSPHLSVSLRDFGSDTVVVYFTAQSPDTTADSSCLEAFFFQERISSIRIVSTKPSWFPPDDMAAAIGELGKLTHNRRVLTFGRSQGAYGALKYSNALDAKIAVAFSPQYSIDPAVVEDYDDRFAEFHVPKLRNGAPISPDDLCPNNYLFVDSLYAPDVRNAAAIRGSAGSTSVVYLIPAPFSRDDTLRVISEGNMLPAFLRSFMAGSPPKAEWLRDMVRSVRNASATYREAKVDYLIRRIGRSTLFLENCIGRSTSSKQQVVELLLVVLQGAFDRAETLLMEIDDSKLALVPTLWLGRFFRRAGFAAGVSRLPSPRQSGTLQDIPAQLRAINAQMMDGQGKAAAIALDRVMESTDGAGHFKRLLHLARRLKHAAALERLLNAPAYDGKMDAQMQFVVRLELAKIYSARKDDEGVRSALRPVDVEAFPVSPFRHQLLDVIALMDNSRACLEFAKQTFNFSEIDLQYLKLRRVYLLQAYAPKNARTQLNELVKSLSDHSLLWAMAAEQFTSQFNFYAAILAQKKAVKLAPKPVPYQFRIALAKLYIREKKHIRARVQLIRIYWKAAEGPERLRPSRDLAVRSGYYRIAGLFARALCKTYPADIEPLIMLSWICCRTNRRWQGSRVATRIIKEMEGGLDPSRSAWPVLVGALSALGRADDARNVLDRGLAVFPNNRALLKIRHSLASVDELVSRVKARE